MDDVIKTIVAALLLIIGIVLAVIYIAIPILIILLVVGSIVGLVYSSRNLFRSSKAAIQSYRNLEGYKDEYARRDYKKDIEEHWTKHFKDDEMYENIAHPLFFYGPCYPFLLRLIKDFFSMNFQYRPDFGKRDSRLKTIAHNVWEGGKALGVYVFGSVFSVLLTLITVIVIITIMLLLCLFSGILIFCDRFYRIIHKVQFICTTCKKTFPLPVYICPVCGLRHRDLKPGRYGIFRRRCLCGTVLPLTVVSKGRMQNDSGISPVRLHDMFTQCPSASCRSVSRSGISRPTGILILGPTYSGKTCLHAAILHTMLEDIQGSGLEWEFTDASMERQYHDSERIFNGEGVTASRRGDRGADIIATTFFVSKKGKLAVPRNVYLYDMAGEVFQDLDPQEGMDVFTNIAGAVVLLDAQEFINTHGGFASMEQTLESLRQSAQLYGSVSGDKCTFPLAFTLSKVDGTMLGALAGDSAIQQIKEKNPDVFSDYYLAMDYVCRSFIYRQTGGPSFLENISHDYQNVRFFSCSSKGDEEDGMPFEPENVLPIVQWLMLRGDKEFARAWRNAGFIPDLSVEQSEMYKTKEELYDEYLRENEEVLVVH